MNKKNRANKRRWQQRRIHRKENLSSLTGIRLMNRIWRSRGITKKPKIKINEAMILMLQSIYLHGSKCWTKQKQD